MPTDSTLIRDVLHTFPGTDTFKRRPTLVPIFSEILNAAGNEPPTVASLANRFFEGRKGATFTALTRLKRILEALYEVEWKHQQQRIVVCTVPVKDPTTGKAGVGYVPEIVANRPPISSYLDYFWHYFLTTRSRNIILISEPQFYGKKADGVDDRCYIRLVKANLPLELNLLQGTVVKPSKWEPANNFVSMGEVLGLFTILHALVFRSRVPVEGKMATTGDRFVRPPQPPVFMPELSMPSRAPKPDSMPGTNLIVLGNPRTNPVFSEQQGRIEPVLYLTRWEIKNRITHQTYTNSVSRRGKAPKEQITETTTYGLLTHKAADHSGAVLLIGGHHCRAIQGVCQAITDLKILADFCERLRVENRLAKYFQVLFKIAVKKNCDGVWIDDWKVEDIVVGPEDAGKVPRGPAYQRGRL